MYSMGGNVVDGEQGVMNNGPYNWVLPHFSCSSGTDFMRPPETGFVTVQSFHDQTWSASQTSND